MNTTYQEMPGRKRGLCDNCAEPASAHTGVELWCPPTHQRHVGRTGVTWGALVVVALVIYVLWLYHAHANPPAVCYLTGCHFTLLGWSQS